jgi:hypothetical protein
MTSSSSNIIAEIQSCTPTYYYYTADLWIDCAGVTAYGVALRSPVILTDVWTRESVAGAYFTNMVSVGGSSYTYESDGTQNSYCGY